MEFADRKKIARLETLKNSNWDRKTAFADRKNRFCGPENSFCGPQKSSADCKNENIDKIKRTTIIRYRCPFLD